MSVVPLWIICLLLLLHPLTVGREPSAENGLADYAGSQVCARCHGRIYRDYIKTAMGRSMVAAREKGDPLPESGAVKVQSGDIWYTVSRQADGLYEADYQLDGSGNAIFENRHRLEYAIGSGVNGTTYLVRRGNRLFEAPLSFYSRAGEWKLSPGYESGTVGFSRPIATGCIFCHSGRVRSVAKSEGLYEDPPFAELAIGCERCHGRGSRHANRPAKNNIVNPAKIGGRLADDVCMSCHQAGDTRAFEPAKTYADFRPGTPLSDTFAIFKIPLRAASAGKQSNLLEHNFALRLSKCYQGSSGRLSCLTCHDPHAVSEKRNVPAYYEAKCMSCHSKSGCKLSPKERAKEVTGCIGCHMPKADVGFVSHSALTNHRIVALPDEPLPAIAYRQTTPDLPDLIYVNRTGDKPVAPWVLLQAYGELMGMDRAYRDRYLKMLDIMSGISPNDPMVLAALGTKAFLDGTANGNQVAIDRLTKAVDSGFTGPAAFEHLAEALAKDGRTTEAIKILQRGIELSPYEPRLHKFLMVQFINAQRYDLVKSEMQHYLELFPEDGFVRDLLRKSGG